MTDAVLPETPEAILRRSLERLERAATEVHRYGAQTGPQWPKLSNALIKARVALMTTPANSVAFLATTWQPIETAPKDGSRFLGTGFDFGLNLNKRHYVVAVWDNDLNWFRNPDADEDFAYLTHWMPVPMLPAES